jgi:hypothetical protein
MMGHGQLRRGRRKIWGTVPDEVFAELERFRLEGRLPSLCRTVGLALEQWAAMRRGEVQNPGDDQEGST